MRPIVRRKKLNISELKKSLLGQTVVSIQPVVGSPLEKTEFIVAMALAAEQAGAKALRIEGVENDPTVKTVLEGAQVMRDFEPDWIIGLGGGSPMDAAKAMWIFYENPDFTFEEAAQPFNLPELRKKARFIAVTTTSGTGSEVTSFSVITDHETNVKYPIADFNITPDMAIVDTDLAQTMPDKLVAHTGMDALTHAIEAYVSTISNELTDALAMQSVEMIQKHLLNSFEGNEEARSKMHLAQCLAGMSFSNAILGIVHSMAHKTGALFKVPHGCANAIYLPHVIRFNAETAGEKFADMSRRLGFAGNQEELVDQLINFVNDLNKKMNIPSSLQAYGVDEKLFLDNLDSISKNAVNDPCTGTNPRQVSIDQMKELFKVSYYG